jgi:hypothetical protein
MAIFIVNDMKYGESADREFRTLESTKYFLNPGSRTPQLLQLPSEFDISLINKCYKQVVRYI